MLVKFDIVMMADPSATETHGEVKGYACFDRSARFRSLTLSRQEAERIFDRVQEYLQEQLGAHIGTAKNKYHG